MYHGVNLPTLVRKRITVKSFAGGIVKGVDQSLSDISRASLSYNFNYFGGTLKKGVGLKSLTDYNLSSLSNLSVLSVYFYKRYDHQKGKRIEKIIYYCSNKKLYYADTVEKVFYKLSDVIFNEKPVAVQYDYLDNDVMLFASKSGELYYLDDVDLIKIDGAPSITSLCVHKERLFVTVEGEGTSLWFSDDFDPTNWVISLTEAGFIDFSDEYGKLLKAVSFLDYVYVFREYGISRVTAYGDQQDFSTDNLFGKQGKIVGSSVTECGDFILMLTSSGIYRFNGLDTVKILDEYDVFLQGVNNDDAKGVFYGNCFYLNLKMNFDGEIKKVLLVYDVIKKSSYLAYGLDVIDLVFTGGDINCVVCITDKSLAPYTLDESGAIDNAPLYKLWSSPKVDLGVNTRLKRLSKLSLFTKEKITLTVECDDKKLSYEIFGGGLQCVQPGLLGETFKINIKTYSSNPEIHSLCACVEYVKEGF